jgi:uncharacterized protein (DUF302 family)
MSYYFSKILDDDFDTSIEKVTEELKKEGFGVLTQIDVKETLAVKNESLGGIAMQVKEKLDRVIGNL